MEIYKDIIGYEGIYQVSNLGNVKSIKLSKEKILKPGVSGGYYLTVALCKDGKPKTKTVHQLVAEAFLNHKADGYKLVVDHINNIKTDNRVENLQLITHRYNCSKDRKGSSIYDGVHLEKSTSKWRARIQINGEKKNLGYFNCEFHAHIAYKKALTQHLQTN